MLAILAMLAISQTNREQLRQQEMTTQRAQQPLFTFTSSSSCCCQESVYPLLLYNSTSTVRFKVV